MKPAIVTVGYNRPKLMKRLLESVGRAYYPYDDVTLIVSIDESDLSDEVEKVAREFVWTHGTKEIRRFSERQGLRRHIVACGDYSEKYGAVIILEDDLVVSDDFYSYVCKAHEKYADDERICGVSLYSFARNQFTGDIFVPQPTEYDVYLGGMVVTWGQSWTCSQWQKFKSWYYEHEDKLPEENPKIPYEISGWKRSWGKYFVSYMAENDLFYVYPYIAHSTCFADLGEHSVNRLSMNCVQVPLSHGKRNYNLGSFDELVKYDAFYERIPERMKICGIDSDKICFSLGGMKTDTLGKRYAITDAPVKGAKKLASFGMRMRPIEVNVLENVPGDDLFLYELKEGTAFLKEKNKKPYKYSLNYKRLRYDHMDMLYRNVAFYWLHEFRTYIKTKIGR